MSKNQRQLMLKLAKKIANKDFVEIFRYDNAANKVIKITIEQQRNFLIDSVCNKFGITQKGEFKKMVKEALTRLNSGENE